MVSDAMLSKENLARIRAGVNPVIDPAWVALFPSDSHRLGDELDIEEIDIHGTSLPCEPCLTSPALKKAANTLMSL